MKILLLTTAFPPHTGGAAVVYGEVCEHAGAQMEVLAPRHSGRADRALDDAADRRHPYGVRRVWYLGGRRHVGGVLGNLAALLNDRVLRRIPAALALAHDVRRAKPDAICVGNLSTMSWMIPVIRWVSSAPVLFYVHGEEVPDNPDGGPLSRWLEGRTFAALSKADGIVAVSRYTEQRLLAVGAPAERIRVIYSGVDHNRFTPGPPDDAIRRRHGLGGGPVLLTVARLDLRKGHDTVIRALPAILQRVPDVRYLIVGGGPQRDELERLVGQLNLQANVTFAGRVPESDLADYYRTCDLFVQPNRTLSNGDTEGFGLVFLEAAACGRASVGGNAGGVPDAIVDGDTGLLVDGNCVDATAAAITRLLTDRQQLDRMAARAMARAREFTWRATARAFENFCRELAGPAANPIEDTATVDGAFQPTGSD